MICNRRAVGFDDAPPEWGHVPGEEWRARNERRHAVWLNREKVLPDWAKALPSHIRTILLNALADGGVADLRPETIRAKGKVWWLQQEGFGRISERLLCAAIGGWSNQAPEIEDDMPGWAQPLSLRLKDALRDALFNGLIPDLERDSIRRAGPGAFLRSPNCGKASITELGHAIGGWETIHSEITAIRDASPNLARMRAGLDAIKAAIARIEAELDRLVA